jgi:hypothetical protein
LPSYQGFSPQLLNFKTLDELYDMESDLWDEIREANEELRAARQDAIEFADDEESLIGTGLEAKNSNDEDGCEESRDSEIPITTVQVFTSSNRGQLRSRYAATSSVDQWGALNQMTMVAFKDRNSLNLLYFAFDWLLQKWHRLPLQKCASIQSLKADAARDHVCIASCLVSANNSKSCQV